VFFPFNLMGEILDVPESFSMIPVLMAVPGVRINTPC